MTRPELRRQRGALARYSRYLPMLKLKQQQLQLTVRQVRQRRGQARAETQEAEGRMAPYRPVLLDTAGMDVEGLARPEEVRTHEENIAGVRVPVFDSVSFGAAEYSLFGTPPWVDRALADLRELNERLARVEVLDRQYDILAAALTKVIQRVNLFEKVLIPQARESIRLIRICLGDEQTAAVGRAKLAKGKLAQQPLGVLRVTAPNGGEGPA